VHPDALSSGAETNRLRRGRRVPFLGHQVAEYAVAVALVAVGFHLNGGAELTLVAAGIVLIVLNLFTIGPLGAVSWLNRRAHHGGDLVIVAALIVAPFFAYGTLHLWGIVLSECLAALILWVERATRYGEPQRRSVSGPAAQVAAATEPGVIESAKITAGVLGPEAADAARRAARHAGFVAGVTRRVVRQRRASGRNQSRSP